MAQNLDNKPLIGMLGGLTSWLSYIIHYLLTDDGVLKVVAGIGVWLGLCIAGITLVIRVIQLFKARK